MQVGLLRSRFVDRPSPDPSRTREGREKTE
jgi:hypothetical protein